MPAKPHRWVPCSVLGPIRGAAPEHQRYAGTHRPPAQRLPPSATGPREGGPLATDRLCSGASPAACGVTSGQRRFPSLPAWLGLTPPVPARRSAAVPAPRSPRYALRAARTAPALGPAARPWAASGGPAAHPTRRCGFASGPSAPLPRRVPPRRPRPRPALPRPSVGWPPGRAAGSAPPARGLERPLRSAFSGHRPRALWGEDKCSKEIAG